MPPNGNGDLSYVRPVTSATTARSDAMSSALLRRHSRMGSIFGGLSRDVER